MEVILRPWQAGDEAALASVMNGADHRFLSDRLPMPYTCKDAGQWLDRVRTCDGQSGLFRAVLADGQLVGMVSLEQKQDVCHRDGELSYLLDARFQGRGIMGAAVRQFCPQAFRQLPLLRITAEVFSDNIASRRVLEKNGFVLEGRLRQAICKGGTVQDLCIYGKLKEDTQP